MNIDIGTRGCGKTSRLIERSARDWLYIVCVDYDRVRATAEAARRMNLDIPFPITFDEFIRGQFSSRYIRGFLVDDVDACLQRFAGPVPIVACTLTLAEEGRK